MKFTCTETFCLHYMRNILDTVTTFGSDSESCWCIEAILNIDLSFRSLRGSIGRGDSGSGSGSSSGSVGDEATQFDAGLNGAQPLNQINQGTCNLHQFAHELPTKQVKAMNSCYMTRKQGFFFRLGWSAHEGRVADVDDIRFLHANTHEIKKMASKAGRLTVCTLNLFKKFCQPRIEESSESHPFAEIEAKLDHISEQVPWKSSRFQNPCFHLGDDGQSFAGF